MSIHPIIKMGHPTLRQVAKPVARNEIDTQALNALIADMKIGRASCRERV